MYNGISYSHTSKWPITFWKRQTIILHRCRRTDGPTDRHSNVYSRVFTTKNSGSFSRTLNFPWWNLISLFSLNRTSTAISCWSRIVATSHHSRDAARTPSISFAYALCQSKWNVHSLAKKCSNRSAGECWLYAFCQSEWYVHLLAMKCSNRRACESSLSVCLSRQSEWKTGRLTDRQIDWITDT